MRGTIDRTETKRRESVSWEAMFANAEMGAYENFGWKYLNALERGNEEWKHQYFDDSHGWRLVRLSHLIGWQNLFLFFEQQFWHLE